MRRALLALPMALLTGLGPMVATSAVAGPDVRVASTAPARAVDLDLRVVRASHGARHIDPQLQSIARHLNVLQYERFEIVQSEHATLSVGRTRSYPVVGGREVRLTVVSQEPQRASVRMQVLKQGQRVMDTTMSIPRGRTVMVAGPRDGDGILVLPVTVGR